MKTENQLYLKDILILEGQLPQPDGWGLLAEVR
jgi:hypothetical protein